MKIRENRMLQRSPRRSGMSRAQAALPLLAIALVLGMIHYLDSAATSSISAPSKRSEFQLARMSEEITVHAAGRGNPWINLSDGHELITPYSGPPELTGLLERNEARPLSLCSADFDEDGVPDLISGYGGPNGGIITLLRGNVDSIYPNAPEAKQRRAEGAFTDTPFLSPAFVFPVPDAADFIGAGDFDGDGHWDVVSAGRRGGKLHLMSGDGTGVLHETKEIDVPGGVSTMVVGEINRRDGLDDLVVGVSSHQGSKLLVFEGPEGALRATPEVFELPAEPASLALGQLDSSYETDLAVASGEEVLVFHGRDRMLSLDAARQAEVKAAAISRRTFPRRISSIAVGDFTGHQAADLAILFADASVHMLSQQENVSPPEAVKSLSGWRDDLVRSNRRPGSSGQLASARIPGSPEDTLLITDPESLQVHVIVSVASGMSADTEPASPGDVSLDAEAAPVALLPMRLNGDALSDLVILTSGRSSVMVAETKPQAAFVVANTNDGGTGSLRQTIIDANNSAGADTITFNIPGAGTKTIDLQGPLPVVTGAATIDGTTQPGFAGTPLIALRRSSVGSTLQISAGNSVVRGLDICSIRPSPQLSATDIEILNGGGNRIEGNVISESGLRISTSSNVVGGTSGMAANQFRATGSSNLVVTGLPSAGNLIQGNSFLAIPGCASSGDCGIAIFLSRAPNSVVGGTIPRSRNVIFGSALTTDIVISDSPGTLIQGNYIGIDSGGTQASGSLAGVRVGGMGVLIGGTTPQARNVISGHAGEGVQFTSDGKVDTNNLLQGNYIGTDSTGIRALGNRDGVVIMSARKTTIGGSDAARNVISGNRGYGIFLVSVDLSFSCGIPLQQDIPNVDFPMISNFIGTDAGGSQPLGNGRDGINIQVNAFSHEIRANRIAFNGRNGIALPETSVLIGDLPAFSIKILDNAIFANGLLGIDLGDDGITQNDLRDLDSGANLRQNFPLVLSSSVPPSFSDESFTPAVRLSLSGTFNSTPNSTFNLQFFFGSGCDASGHQFTGAIPISLGSLLVTTDSNGNAPYAFGFDFPVGRSTGFVNSTATDSNGNTSEISLCLPVISPLRITDACKGEGKQLLINGSGFVEGAKVFLNGEQQKTSFVASTHVIAKKAGKRAQTGDTLKVRNPDGSETALITYTRVNCSP